jgi:hypothetical protein
VSESVALQEGAGKMQMVHESAERAGGLQVVQECTDVQEGSKSVGAIILLAAVS